MVRRVARRILLSLLALAAAATSCGDDRASVAPVRPPVVLNVTMSEFAFKHREEIPAGRVVVKVDNDGQLEHELRLIPLPEDLPPIPEQLRSEQRQALPTTAILQLGPPGSGTFAVDLAPGRYGLVCFLEDIEGERHALKGMSSEFRVI